MMNQNKHISRKMKNDCAIGNAVSMCGNDFHVLSTV